MTVYAVNTSYDTICKIVGNDGTVEPRDDSKEMCRWIYKTPYGEIEIYDYKVGLCYDYRDGLQREEIDEWHVQFLGTKSAREENEANAIEWLNNDIEEYE